jgi:hypothetical protein
VATTGFMLPPRDIPEPRNLVKSVVRIYVPIVVIVMALLLVLNHHSSGVIGGIVAVGVIALILGIELPLIVRAQDRRQQSLTEDLPEGGFYAGRASLLAHDGRRLPVLGTILFTDSGVNFSPKKARIPPLTLAWNDVSRIRLAANPGQIGVGRLTLALTDSATRVFTVPRYGAMARALAQQP